MQPKLRSQSMLIFCLTTSPRMTQKCAQWFFLHKKLFFYILDICIINSYTMHKEVGGNKSLGEFKLELVKNIITSSTLPNYSSRGRPHSGPTPLRLQGRHFPKKIQPPSNSNNEYYKKRCMVCYQRHIRMETTYQ